MSDLKDILEKLSRPLDLEARIGYGNDSVLGGLDRYMEQWSTAGIEVAEEAQVRAKLTELRALFADYRTSDPYTRQRKIQRAKSLLTGLQQWLCTPTARNLPPPRVLLEPVPSPTVPTSSPPEKRRKPPSPRTGGQKAKPPKSRPPKTDPEELSSPVQYLRGVGPVRAGQLARLGIHTIGDLFTYFPRAYEDRRTIVPLGYAEPHRKQCFYGVVQKVSLSQPRPNLKIVKVLVADGTGAATLVWFHQPYRQQLHKPGDRLFISGRLTYDKFGCPQILHPDVEEFVEEEDSIHAGRIVPVYPLTEGLTQRQARQFMWNLMEEYITALPEVLPETVRQAHRLLPRQEAMRQMHFPDDFRQQEKARRRLAFEEFFGLQVALAQRRLAYVGQPGIAFRTASPLAEALVESLPFELTRSQRRVVEEIKQDLAQPRPMNRLLHGDVGSGKTVVALIALLIAVDNGYQTAFMAPTEILAEQQYYVMREWVEPLGVRVDLLIGSLTPRVKQEVRERIASGETQIAVGTHALIQEEVGFANLGLVVVDEQHRFGVMQRATLLRKGTRPDVLVMTATPIPRTLALTVHGDLEVSAIKEMPPGRTPVETRWFPLSARRKVYQLVREQLRAGRQAYVVCPLIEESEAWEEVRAATEIAEKLQQEFKGFRVGLLHGRMSGAEKDAIMRAFRDREIDLLTATTVVEVGIDVPNATVMVILNAERFGLAQLHQLRGRVGRGAEKSYCFVLTEAKYNPQAPEDEYNAPYHDGRRRMQVFTETNDGFRIAEVDLELRGPGELAGTRQSGLPDLYVANLVKDVDLLVEARQAAQALVAKDPQLAHSEHASLRRFVEERFHPRVFLVEVG